MKVFAIANQKGGVGKSTIACHLSWYLQELGHRVLHIDLDPQGNSSSTLSAFATSTTASAFFLPEAPIVEPIDGGLSLVAADSDLLEIERASNSVMKYFADAVLAQEDSFDYIVIDTAPTAGIKMSAALAASTDVFSPIELESYSMDGFKSLIKTIIYVKQKLNPKMNFIGALPNRFNAVSPTQKKNLNELLETAGAYLVPTHIPTRSAISEAIAEGIPVWKSTKSSAREAGRDLKKVLDMILERSSK